MLTWIWHDPYDHGRTAGMALAARSREQARAARCLLERIPDPFGNLALALIMDRTQLTLTHDLRQLPGRLGDLALQLGLDAWVPSRVYG